MCTCTLWIQHCVSTTPACTPPPEPWNSQLRPGLQSAKSQLSSWEWLLIQQPLLFFHLFLELKILIPGFKPILLIWPDYSRPSEPFGIFILLSQILVVLLSSVSCKCEKQAFFVFKSLESNLKKTSQNPRTQEHTVKDFLLINVAPLISFFCYDDSSLYRTTSPQFRIYSSKILK